MGQKVSPHGLRVGVIKDWDSKWYAGKGNFADMLVEDNKIRSFVKKKLYAKARYDMYQPSKGAEKQRTLCEVGLNYEFNQNVQLSSEYAHVHDRSLAKPDYSVVDVQLIFKF